MSTRPMTAVTMIAPNTRLGVYWNNGIKKSSVTITVTAMIMFETAVLAPALWFTADRENAPRIMTVAVRVQVKIQDVQVVKLIFFLLQGIRKLNFRVSKKFLFIN